MSNNQLRMVAREDDGDELLGSRMLMRFDAPIEMIRSLRTHGDAFTLACNASGLSDKEIYDHEDLQIDQAQFSKMKSGQVGIHPSLEAAFCRVIGNRIYPEWKAYQLGCTLVMIETEAERLYETEREKNAALMVKIDVLTEAIHGKVR